MVRKASVQLRTGMVSSSGASAGNRGQNGAASTYSTPPTGSATARAAARKANAAWKPSQDTSRLVSGALTRAASSPKLCRPDRRRRSKGITAEVNAAARAWALAASAFSAPSRRGSGYNPTPRGRNGNRATPATSTPSDASQYQPSRSRNTRSRRRESRLARLGSLTCSIMPEAATAVGIASYTPNRPGGCIGTDSAPP